MALGLNSLSVLISVLLVQLTVTSAVSVPVVELTGRGGPDWKRQIDAKSLETTGTELGGPDWKRELITDNVEKRTPDLELRGPEGKHMAIREATAGSGSPDWKRGGPDWKRGGPDWKRLDTNLD